MRLLKRALTTTPLVVLVGGVAHASIQSIQKPTLDPKSPEIGGLGRSSSGSDGGELIETEEGTIGDFVKDAVWQGSAKETALALINNPESAWGQLQGSLQQYLTKTACQEQPMVKHIMSSCNAPESGGQAAGGKIPPITDENEIAQRILERLKKSENSTGINPVIQADLGVTDYDSDYVRAAAGALLGEKQQKQNAQLGKKVLKSAKQTGALAKKAQKQKVTQKVVKHLTQQNARQAQIQAAIRTSSQQSAQQQAATNVAVSDMAETLNQREREREFEEAAGAQAALSRAAKNAAYWAKDDGEEGS